jgi:hypothetical protein
VLFVSNFGHITYIIICDRPDTRLANPEPGSLMLR